MKTILFITGSRADFGKMFPLIEAVNNDNNNRYDCRIFCTGMHMLSRYGSTYIEIHKRHLTPYLYINQIVNTPMPEAIANTITGLSHYITENPVDLIVVHGDRLEALAGAIVGSMTNTLVAHIEGGEVSGTIDEGIRHATSKLAHIHFAANEMAANRLRRMGERNIHVIGSPEVDIMLSDKLPSMADVAYKYCIPWNDYAILIYHPVTTEPSNLDLFDVIKWDTGHNYIILYPNCDPGNNAIMERIESLDGANILKIPSMRFEHYLTLLKHAQFIIGNSSSGIREAPVYGTPTIDIGTRQEGRYSCRSIVNCRTIAEIEAAIANPPPRIKSMAFGTGNSADQFMACLPDVWGVSTQKRFVV